MIPSQKSPYNTEQIACICETLYRAKDVQGLNRFFNYIDADDYCSSADPSVLRAQILLFFARKSYAEVFTILKSFHFESKYHEELQDIWWKSHYAELELHRAKPLGAVEKYRLRKKFPPPLTIWDGEEIIYSFKENSRKYTATLRYVPLGFVTPLTESWWTDAEVKRHMQLLKCYYKQNKYPCAEEKKLITERTGLSFTQVSNWFKNRRQREKGENSGDEDNDMFFEKDMKISV